MASLQQQDTCANPSCVTTKGLQLKKCGRCRAASYCSQKCQKEDFSLHKQWCRAAHDAHGCTVCKLIGEALPPTIPLHYAGNDPASGSLDKTTEKFALVFHAPFSARISKQVERVGGRFDLIVQYAGAAHVTMTDRISVDRIRRAFAKSDDACSICLTHPCEHNASGRTMAMAACPKCQNNICGSCIRKLDETSVKIELLCNTCQTTDRFARTLADGSVVCSGCVQPLVANRIFACPTCRNPLRYTGQLDAF